MQSGLFELSIMCRAADEFMAALNNFLRLTILSRTNFATAKLSTRVQRPTGLRLLLRSARNAELAFRARNDQLQFARAARMNQQHASKRHVIQNQRCITKQFACSSKYDLEVKT